MAAKTAKASKLNSGRTSNGTSPNVDATSLHVSLPQMLDLALGTPEVGAVNLNILHNFLHVLLHQINLRTTKVEYRGEDANRIKTAVASLKAGPSLHLHEYNIVDGSGRTKQRINSTDNLTVNVDVYTEAEEKSPSPGKSGKHSKPAASAPTTARGKTANEQGSDTSLEEAADLHGLPGAKKTKGVKQHIGAGQDGKGYRQSVIFVEPIVNGAAPTALGFKQLEDTVRKLQQRFQALEEFANDPEMIERVKTNSTDPLSDMWHIININKRLDATEQGIDKLTTMLHELIKSDKTEVVGDRSEAEAGTDEISKQLADIEQRLMDLEINVDFLRHGEEEEEKYAGNVRHTEPDSDTVSPGTVAGGTGTDELERGGTVENGEGRAGSSTAQRKVSIGGSRTSVADIREDINTLKNEIARVRRDIVLLNSRVDQLQEGGERAPPSSNDVAASDGSTVDGGQTAVIKKESIEGEKSENEPDGAKMSRCLEAIHNVEEMYGDALQELNGRMQELEKDVSCLMETVNSGPMAGVGPEGSQGLNELFTKIQGIQADVEHLNQTASKLLDERENRETNTHALLEQIELLKTVKADKEDLEDALADKADAQTINRKVSYDQFDAVCDDLARGLEDAITKLSQQESIWQQALDEVQREIEGKLDKIEISPLKDFVNNKLKTLQQKLKILSELKQESEAAGTKKMLRDVQCLSCDKDVVMKMQEGLAYRAEALPCTRSMKPYLTYELDQVRKQQRRLPHGRNMIQFEAAIHEESKKLKTARDDTLGKSPRDHLCNRYCGGSHTVTTPQQRVMRMGHFLTQWGPEAVQLTEGIVHGTDGQVYRGRPMLEKLDVHGPCGGEGRVTSAPTETEVPDAHRTSQSNLRRGSITSQRRLSARKVPAANEAVLQNSMIQESIVEETQQSAPAALEAKPSEEKKNRGKSHSESSKAVEEIVPASEERPLGDDGAEEEEGDLANDE